MNAVRTWVIQGKILFPKLLLPRPGGLDTMSRIPIAAKQTDEVSLSIRPTREPQPDLFHEWARLAGTVAAESPEEALDFLLPLLACVLESMAFQMQEVLRLDSLEALDVTRPARVGDEREMLLSPSPHGHPSIVFSPASVAIGGVETRNVPDPWLELTADSTKALRALDWYLKALAATLQVDQFIFLWVATEILAGDGHAIVERNYVADCGHEIAECPQCGRSTAKKVQGKTVQAFLQSDFNLDEDQARTAWQMRQMLHGAIDFQSTKMESLPRLCGALRAGVLKGVKKAFSIDLTSPPNFKTEGAILMIPGLQLPGSRAICEEDLLP